MALISDDISGQGKHSAVIPSGSLAGIYEFPLSPGRRINVIIGNPGAQAFDHIYYNFTESEASAFNISRVKAVVETGIVETNYSSSSIVGMRTVGIELQGTSTSDLTFEVLESKV